MLARPKNPPVEHVDASVRVGILNRPRASVNENSSNLSSSRAPSEHRHGACVKFELRSSQAIDARAPKMRSLDRTRLRH